eukprot:CAMPEP_0168442242 /NCGR_PEP_ID=MMETSP0228-20121227/43907_1 /TAXON_ID=133427 /ORGANISM="Protoceratium reticulatum, Strain CCCM 535 (=CCMP 1889)" /LENGTH=99 /DNA_ID=CAMNT_0008456597 /DNA_START=111 /DNA_END=407 /DNA_ORIENTATION=-
MPQRVAKVRSNKKAHPKSHPSLSHALLGAQHATESGDSLVDKRKIQAFAKCVYWAQLATARALTLVTTTSSMNTADRKKSHHVQLSKFFTCHMQLCPHR